MKSLIMYAFETVVTSFEFAFLFGQRTASIYIVIRSVMKFLIKTEKDVSFVATSCCVSKLLL